MTPPQSLGVLIAVALFSLLIVALYHVQKLLGTNPATRVRYLRCGTVSMWLVAVLSVAVQSLNGGQVVGNLLPRSEHVDRAMSVPRVLAFEGQNSLGLRWVLLGYILAVAFGLARLLQSYLKMRRILLNSSGASMEGQVFRTTDLTDSPFSFGFLNPQVFIPVNFLMEEQRRVLEVALIHEQAHLQNRDPQWKLIALLTRAVFFLAPGAWYLQRSLDLDSEIECDRLTMCKAQIGFRDYGILLLDTVAKIQEKRQSPMFSYMSDNNLRRRIEAMKAKTVARPWLSVISAGLLFVASVSAIASTLGVARFKGQFKVKAQVLVDGVVVSAPQFVVLANESASLEMKSEHPQSALRMMLTAADYATSELSDGIELKMAVELKTQEQSFRVNPRVIVAPGEEGSVVLANGNDKMEIKVTAERQ